MDIDHVSETFQTQCCFLTKQCLEKSAMKIEDSKVHVREH